MYLWSHRPAFSGLLFFSRYRAGFNVGFFLGETSQWGIPYTCIKNSACAKSLKLMVHHNLLLFFCPHSLVQWLKGLPPEKPVTGSTSSRPSLTSYGDAFRLILKAKNFLVSAQLLTQNLIGSERNLISSRNCTAFTTLSWTVWMDIMISFGQRQV